MIRASRPEWTSASAWMLVVWLALLVGLSGSAWAGPNANGVLVVHDPGIVFTDTGEPPFPSETPPCAAMDNELPAGIPPGGLAYVWKVYAAFPLDSSPRLKAFAMGAQFPPSVTVVAGGVIHEMDFENPTAGWPFLSGYGVMVNFWQLQTSRVVECYWLAGYAYSGVWALAQHPTVLNTFVDDSVPPIEEPVVGLGSIGFGEPGATFCPYDDSPGACCLLDGSCRVTDHTECDLLQGIFRGVMYDCDPFPCHIGACCYWDHCEYLSPEECEMLPAIYLGDLVLCEPYPCQPNTVCCSGTVCWLCPAWACEAGGFLPMPELTSCYPNPCPPAAWACCLQDGTCQITTEWQCENINGTWLPAVDCVPDPCGPTRIGNTSWGRIKSHYR